MYLGLDLRGGVHFLLQVDMKAALDKAADRYTDRHPLADAREEGRRTRGVAREGQNVVLRFRDDGRAQQGAHRDRQRVSRPAAARADADAAASSGSSRA